MLFNSFHFLIFFPIVTLVYFLLPHRFRWLHLLVASCIFYMAFIPAYILILFVTIVVDYIAGIMIEREFGKKRRLYLILSIVVNLGFLGFFKYYNFFIENVEAIFRMLHIATHTLPYLNIILPIGLSFHTFQAMSYTIEVYRGNQKAESHFGIYALYVMFYPQLVAGPIERPQNMLHQFKIEHKFDSLNLMMGLRLMLWGLFKKLVIADRLSIYVTQVYNAPGDWHYINILIAILFFSIQIYCDFSGYSDIALGSAQTMGFKLMTNFNRPFLYSTSITEFWRRWHISLYSWFNDYLYTPLALSFRDYGKWGIAAAVSITFLLSGLWHGAKWTFVIWGLMHAIALVYEMFTKKARKKLSKKVNTFLYDKASLLITFIILNFIWIFFRANSLEDAFTILRYVFTLNHKVAFKSEMSVMSSGIVFGRLSVYVSIIMTVFMFLVESNVKVDLTDFNDRPILNIIFSTFVLTMIVLFGVFNSNSFIYFQF